jgi:hypothetical protein
VTHERELPVALRAWLTRDDHDVAGWAPDPPAAELRCAPELVERLTQVARPAARDAARVWVEGCPVVHHPNGAPIACAYGADTLVVRSGEPAGALAPAAPVGGLDDTWVALDPWAVDTSFARTGELLKMHVHRAYELAGARAWR